MYNMFGTASISERYERLRSELEELEKTKIAHEITHQNALDTVNDYEDKIIQAQKDQDNYKMAVGELKTITNDIDEDVKKRLEQTLNFSLDTIPLKQNFEAKVQILPSGRSGKTFEILLRDKDSGKERYLNDQVGTAVPQMLSFLIRMIFLNYRQSAKIMIEDEMFTGLHDKETIHMFGEILEALAKNERYQIIIVEHKSELINVENVHQIYVDLTDYDEGLKVVGYGEKGVSYQEFVETLNPA